MADKQNDLTEEQKKAVKFLTRRAPHIAPKSDEQLAREAEEKAFANAKTGEVMPDGTIYLGCYNDKDWFATAEDARDGNGKNLLMDFNAAAAYAKKLKAHGHDDWMVPPYSGKNEPRILDEMFNSKSIGAFQHTYNKASQRIHNENYSTDSSYYWSSTELSSNLSCAMRKDFISGSFGWFSKTDLHSVRCVRAVPRLQV